MTRLVVVQTPTGVPPGGGTAGGDYTGRLTALPIGVEQGAIYTLIGPDGTRAVFNNSTDRDFVGFLTEPPSGFDSAEVRESADVVTEGDGGVHGNFYLGRRPWTFTGMIDPTARLPEELSLPMAAIVNARINRLERASLALRADATLTWTPTGGVGVQLRSRYQSLRVTQRHPKTFLLAMVAADPRIYGQILKTASAVATSSLAVFNAGGSPSPPVITLRGAWVNPVLTNTLTGEDIRLTANSGLTMATNDTLVIDVAAKTIMHNGSINRYDRFDFPTSEWWQVYSGDNTLSATGGPAGASWQVDWRDAWGGV